MRPKARSAAVATGALPAKVAPRRLPHALPRERLFALLDGCRANPLAWVQGPAGSGKTTLVSSYVEWRGLPCVWYRADEGDIDPVLCFSLLAQAVAACTAAPRCELPALTPEVLPELPAFTRRFVRAMCDALPPDGVLLFDEMEASGGELLQAVIRAACQDMHPGQRILATSRQAPPPALTHLRVKGSMHVVAWHELKLTADEARSIAERRAPAAAPDSDHLMGLCGGWVAGYVALLDAETRSAGSAGRPRVIDEEIFPYFLNEVLARAQPQARQVLLRTSVLETFSAVDGAELCGACAADLDRLCRDIGFVERSAGDPPSYRVHPLFREFLRHTLAHELAAGGRADLERQAGRMLLRRGEHDAALSLLCAAQAWTEVAAALRELAPGLIAQGRHVTLERALARLPASVVDQDPWLGHWQAMAWMPAAPHRARQAFEVAHAAFEAAADPVGSAACCSGVLEATMLEWSDLRHLDRWGDRLRVLLDRPHADLPPAVAARAWGSVSALLMRGPRHNDLADRALRLALERLGADDDGAQRFGAALRALNLLKYRFRWADACALWAEVQAWLVPEQLSPLHRVMWYSSGGAVAFWGGDFDAARERLSTSLELARAHSIRALDVVNSNMLLMLALSQGRPDEADRHLDRAAAALHPERAVDAASYSFMRAVDALARGQVVDALGYALRSIERAEACGAQPFAEQGRAVLAAAQVLNGQFDAASETAARMLDYARSGQVDALRHSALLLQAWAHGRAGRVPLVLPLLREALALGRERRLRVVFPWVPVPLLQELAALALEQAVEPEVVSEMLQRRPVPPPADAPAQWPWPIRVHCLGAFELWLGGELFRPAAKAPRKPLELLKALIALGGQSVSLASVREALWPDLEGDAAHNAFSAALHRLRGLLRDEQAIVVRDGRGSIDGQRVWVDAIALRQQAEAIDASPSTDAGDAAAAERSIERLLALYRGPFLDDDDSYWAVACREQLRSRLLRSCTRIGQRLETLQRFDAAERLYARAIERDAAVEALHRGVMRCMAATGRHAEVPDAFRRCVAALRQHSGQLPSDATQALALALAKAQPR